MRRAPRQPLCELPRLPRLHGGLDEERMCWICLDGDEGPSQRTDWLHPCRCRGSNKWVHRNCLNRWIDELQLRHPNKPIACSQCRTEYIIVTTPLCRFDALLSGIDNFYGAVCPSVTMGTISAALYFSAMTFGALTLIQIIGYRKSLALLNEETTLLIIGLPTIPVGLLLLRRIRLDDYMLRFLRIFRSRRHGVQPEDLDEAGERLPGAPLDANYFDDLSQDHTELQDSEIFGSEAMRRASTSFVVALSLPSFAVLLGRSLYAKMENRFLGILLGGMTFLGIKGLASAYVRHSHVQRLRGRSVLDHVQR
ncbi:E3 ubiquitin-protein ligase MARCHF5-like [Drosophila obscura]|uniref:E3 ubiquitin-protein ligase MARCHF5-like n=1 Tax=Drosophila obscura TaxID=7282 RepID=UPI001BB254B3|nr:E3 ubiquitin-protein ligase MARCHF5-like [Drosophila obscura]